MFDGFNSDEALSRLRGSRRLLALTGAGISAESGLATFRGAGGLWEGRPAADLATPEAFRDDPRTVWRFYLERRRRAREAEPNAAHRALAAWPGLRVVTQNVDGLHERAGSRDVLALHGSLWRDRCTSCGRETDADEGAPVELPPRCACGGTLRPGVVWFGEALPAGALAEADRLAREAEVVLVIGTSSLVYPAAALPDVARAAGAWVVEINPERTALTSRVDAYLAGPAGEIVPELHRRAAAAPPMS